MQKTLFKKRKVKKTLTQTVEIGYDLDGTICTRPEIDKKYKDCNGLERKAYQTIKDHHIKTAELIRRPTEAKYYIITSRKPKYRSLTLQWLKSRGLKPIGVFFMEERRTRGYMIAYKSHLINLLMLTRYYEDDSKIAKSLARKCPNTQIITVEAVKRQYMLNNFLGLPIQN